MFSFFTVLVEETITISRHTFKMAAMASARRSLQQRPSAARWLSERV